MRLFTCGACDHTVFFENVRCTQCAHALAYLPDARRVAAIEPLAEDPSIFVALAGVAEGRRYRLCANSTQYGVCNWAIRAADPEPLCACCRLNDVIPNLSKPENLGAWSLLEAGKRRLVYSLQGLGLPIESPVEREKGLVFKFMEDAADGSEKVFTGHDEGVITINLNEADAPFREKLRKDLGEGYRTVLGHFRHEIGHYYWDRLVRDAAWLAPCRALFGDETASYEEALKHHYAHPPASDWPLHYVSSYATMHPWEDWAETWAHYLHMVDTLETARGYGLTLRPKTEDGVRHDAVTTRALDFDDFDELLGAWVPVSLALNSLNRSMGLSDPYPFVLSTDVIEKLRFVHDVIEHGVARDKVQRQVADGWLARIAAKRKADKQTDVDATLAQVARADTDAALAQVARADADAALAQVVRADADAALAQVARADADAALAQVARADADAALAQVARADADAALAQVAKAPAVPSV